MNHYFEANKAKAEKKIIFYLIKLVRTHKRSKRLWMKQTAKKKYVAGQTSVQYL